MSADSCLGERMWDSDCNKLYARMLLQIGIGRREIAARILRWVVMAVRPLTLPELSTAIEATVRPSAILSRDEVVRDQVLNCGYILTIEGDRVGLLHQSAKDYLLRKTPDADLKLEYFRVKEEAANLEITRRCLDYLQQGALATGEVNLCSNTSRLKAFPLLSYAALHWPEHAKSLNCSEDVFNLSLPFYDEKSQIRQSWLRTYWAAKRHEKPPNQFTLLHLASYAGILPIAENHLAKNGWIDRVKRFFYLNKTDDWGMTALIWAVSGGYEAVVRLLLEKGADVNTKDKYMRETALHMVATNGDEAMARLLLEKGADMNIKNKDKETALHLAAAYRHDAVVQLLLEKGADVNAKDKDAWAALQLAARYGDEEVVQLLLDNGADVNAKISTGHTALHEATMGGHKDVAQQLLKKGADVNAKDGQGRTALATYRHDAVVQLLLETGPDVNAKNEDGDTALHTAARYGYEAVVRLLLEMAADVNAKNRKDQTALDVAAERGHEAVVQLLTPLCQPSL